MYAGYGAGSYYTYSGGGVNSVCLSGDPSFDNIDVSGTSSVQMLYLLEFSTSTSYGTTLSDVNNKQLPCVVCRTSASDVYMNPGQQSCPNNFLVAYAGFLMSSHMSQYKLDYVCADKDSVAADWTQSSATSYSLLYPQEIDVQTYPSYYEATCAMCESDPKTNPGAIYERWGRQDCPSDGTLLRAGIMAHSPDSTSTSWGRGGGSNYLCLPYGENAEWDAPKSGKQSSGLIRRVEYQLSNVQTWASINNYDAPCAVCQAGGGRRTSIMVPGRLTCPTSMTTEYSGFLASSYYTHSKSEYACIDVNAMVEPKGSSSSDSTVAYLYTTEFDRTVWPVYPGQGYRVNRDVPCSQCTSSQGPTYVRWGKRSCPSQDTAVYSGFTAGSYSSRTGNGANTLCMHPDAQYKFSPSDSPLYTDTSNDQSIIYPTEYRTSTYSDQQYKDVDGFVAACTVCQTTASSVFVQWGSSFCPAGTLLIVFQYFSRHISHEFLSFRLPPRVRWHGYESGI